MYGCSGSVGSPVQTQKNGNWDDIGSQAKAL